MHKGRVEAFSDGVIAIIITIMVLDLKGPGSSWATIHDALKSVAWYLLSFTLVGIYWNNHHHMFAVTKHVNGAVLWANLHLLFWLSLVPFVTKWMGSGEARALSTLTYGVVLLAAGIAYTILQQCILRLEGPNSQLARAVGRDRKGRLSVVFYVVAVAFAMFFPWVADTLFVAVALMWIVPDPRIERKVGHVSHEE